MGGVGLHPGIDVLIGAIVNAAEEHTQRSDTTLRGLQRHGSC